MPSLEDDLAAAIPEPTLKDLASLAAKLHAEGHDFRIVDGQLLVGTAPTDVDRETKIDIGKEHLRIALVSDTHGGSLYEQNTALHHTYRYCDGLEKDPVTKKYAEPVDYFVHGGDFSQGSDKMHRDQPFSVHVHGFEQQTDYVVGTYPKSERGTPTLAISGNHDDSWLNGDGGNIVRTISERRSDIVYMGQDAAYLTIGGLKMYVVHPEGGSAYAKSYNPQKFAEALPISRAVNLLAIGHLHSFNIGEDHGVMHVLMPCYQSQYAWMARKKLHPALGCVIVDVYMTDKGEVGRMTFERLRYQAVRDDWDHDVSNAVLRGWHPDGIVLPTPKRRRKVVN
jgi:predicted phosphodiesterase